MERWREKKIIDEFLIYMRQYLKLDAFAVISGMKISKIFRVFSSGPPRCGLAKLGPPKAFFPAMVLEISCRIT